jgi:hypothetical protein
MAGASTEAEHIADNAGCGALLRNASLHPRVGRSTPIGQVVDVDDVDVDCDMSGKTMILCLPPNVLQASDFVNSCTSIRYLKYHW